MKLHRIQNPSTRVPGAVWFSGLDTIQAQQPRQLPEEPQPQPEPEPPPVPEPPKQEPPAPSDRDLKWKAALEQADEIATALRAEPDFSGEVLVAVVGSMLDSAFTADDVIAAYHRRMEQRRG